MIILSKLSLFQCTNSVLQVKGKLNSITLDNCKKCGVVFEDLISTCEFVNCQSVKAQGMLGNKLKSFLKG